MDNILNRIFPPKCLFCGTVGSVFCESCLSACRLVRYQKCVVCDKPSPNGLTHSYCRRPYRPSQLISIYEYSGKIRECIKKSKYSSKQFLALKVLAREALGLSYEWAGDFKGFICVPIPLSRNRYMERGFNQAYILGRILAKGWKLPVNEGALLRIRGTKAQHLINREERFKNISGSFKAVRQSVSGAKIMLIDDICTTGATLLEASKALYLAGAAEIRCFTLSKKL